MKFAFEIPMTSKPWKIAICDDVLVLVNEEHHPYIIRELEGGGLYLFPLDGSMKAEKPMEINSD